MANLNPNISTDDAPMRPVIRQLDEAAVNRIAAGEVVERPASAVKELVENAIDAGARRVMVEVAHGGKTLIRVTDDGCGMEADDLPMALSRHATSKIDGSDLLNIHSFGFRGEALPSLGSVGRLSITSRASDAAHMIRVTGGTHEAVRPAALNTGTVVELRDLFYATPARLKFLRTDRAEMQAISDVVKRLAMAEPSIGFTLKDVTEGERTTFRVDPESGDLFDALRGRLTAIMGREFTDNALLIDADREGLNLTGYAALPTYSRGSAVAQFLFVNGRPVRDKLLIGALRAAYMDVLSRDRHPAAVLFIGCPSERVDVNVHPAKSEVRFREPAVARSLIVTGLRHALAEAGHRASTTVADATMQAFQPAHEERAPLSHDAPRVYQMDRTGQQRGFAPIRQMHEPAPQWAAPSARVDEAVIESDGPLGAARAQVHENYIIAQTPRGIVLVDQHAAHERLVYEKLKKQMAENGVARQALLIPEIITLGPDADRLLDHAEELARFGLVIEPFGPGTIAVRETPAILGEINAEAMLRDVLDELADLGDSQTLQARVEAVLSRVACHGSIRSGRQMRADEMNALLREMEATPLSGQCNHGRPTYVELKLADIERLFGRT
ncbi:DNA mismatch repair endonuclease MutL [Gymnodinialimonas ceratoperidinii]|uniref:DNA mismatch repair protein MutL n=1 Tax=Gymnodinialimonas ceratoperidinii TaxID=2856823 RepID=A0A8F6YAQ4_9RHOB|nr:DNA mismatch repair endonuclease MutL [Gymnodinialimonas ceratoperidinii]QXT40179.1 DNA mismatch repair endonuclease MutL [Gymnodinialimonas ceratoperidinii]